MRVAAFDSANVPFRRGTLLRRVTSLFFFLQPRLTAAILCPQVGERGLTLRQVHLSTHCEIESTDLVVVAARRYEFESTL